MKSKVKVEISKGWQFPAVFFSNVPQTVWWFSEERFRLDTSMRYEFHFTWKKNAFPKNYMEYDWWYYFYQE